MKLFVRKRRRLVRVSVLAAVVAATLACDYNVVEFYYPTLKEAQAAGIPLPAPELSSASEIHVWRNIDSGFERGCLQFDPSDAAAVERGLAGWTTQEGIAPEWERRPWWSAEYGPAPELSKVDRWETYWAPRVPRRRALVVGMAKEKGLLCWRRGPLLLLGSPSPE